MTKPRIRWHISSDTAAKLERVRRLAGHKSWDEFFKTIISEKENSKHSLNYSDTINLNATNAKLDSIHNIVTKVGGQIEEVDAMLQDDKTERDEIKSTMRAIRFLLARAMDLENPQSSAETPVNEEKLTKLQQRIRRRMS